MTWVSRYRVFCPHCGHHYNASVDDREVREMIDRICPQCYLVGQDAVVVGHDQTRVGK